MRRVLVWLSWGWLVLLLLVFLGMTLAGLWVLMSNPQTRPMGLVCLGLMALFPITAGAVFVIMSR
jgi:hypothetical protein